MTPILLDVHILVSGFTPDSILAECLRSVTVAQTNANGMVAVHLIKGPTGDEGGIWRGRQLGLACGSAPYVGWVDDDDIVHPDLFTEVIKQMADHPTMICTREQYLREDNSLEPSPNIQHHFVAIQRAIAERYDHAYYRDHTSQTLRATASNNVAYIDRVLYTYRCPRTKRRSAHLRRQGALQ